MFSELRRRSRRAGLPPGTVIYTGEQKTVAPRVTTIHYGVDKFQETSAATLATVLPELKEAEVVWIHVEGLNNTEIISQLGNRFNLHPLTVEDILHTDQRPKVEEFPNYVFVVMRVLVWDAKNMSFSMEQLSLVFGKGFLLSFQEQNSVLFDTVKERLRNSQGRLRSQNSDYLAYRLIDTIVDQYFVALEGIGDQIEKIEELIITTPTPENARTIYKLKQQMLAIRKAIWPLREAINHLLQVDGGLVTPFTTVYLRDVYDHTVQTMDTVETFRDMLGSMLDIYLSSLTNRINEVMKVLTIIATIFMPITFIASIYGMNFINMPELHWRWGYPAVLGLMSAVVIVMLVYFRRKRWL